MRVILLIFIDFLFQLLYYLLDMFVRGVVTHDVYLLRLLLHVAVFLVGPSLLQLDCIAVTLREPTRGLSASF